VDECKRLVHKKNLCTESGNAMQKKTLEGRKKTDMLARKERLNYTILHYPSSFAFKKNEITDSLIEIPEV